MRRYLCFAPPLGELDLDLRGYFYAKAFPDEQRLAIVAICAERADDGLRGPALRIVDRSMRLLHDLKVDLNSTWASAPSGVAMSDDAVFVCSDADGIRRYALDNHSLTRHFIPDEAEDEDLCGATFDVAFANGTLFAVNYDDDDDTDDKLFALDPDTLEVRFEFGDGLSNDLRRMAVVGNELFVSDCRHHCLRVFSFSGDHLRDVRGAFRRPSYLCVYGDRLYLAESGLASDHAEEPEQQMDEKDVGTRGKRIFALTLQGATLQVVETPDDGYVHGISLFAGRMIVQVGPSPLIDVDVECNLLYLKGM
eukprot:4078916-Prymnesium_polylepis.1